MRPLIVVSRGPLPVGSYSDRLRDAGAEPKEIRAGDPVPDHFDALCLSGGPDVWWRIYGQRRAGSAEPDVARDYLEIEQLLPRATELNVPILAICRGLQVLNVHLGGTLIQDIGEAHQAKGADVKPHDVRADPLSRVGELCGVSFTVNSRHHQVLDRVAPSLRAVGWSDPYVEAAESTDGRWMVGVQWHPERVQDQVPNNGIGLFDAFVEAATPVPAR